MVRAIGCMFVAAALLLGVGCNRSPKQQSSSSGQKLVIGVVPKSVNHLYWKTVEKGARQGAKEAGVEIRWLGPNSESDREGQIRIIGDLAESCNAICVAPNDADALIDVIVQTHKKMPLIVFDSGVNTKDYDAFIATDNRRGGEIAGQYMLKLLGDKGGKIAIIRGAAGSQSTTEREEGFLSAVRKNPNVKISEFRGDNETAASQRVAADEIQKDPDVAGFFGSSELTSIGIMLALQDAHKAGQVKCIGFDGGPELARGMDQKVIDALVVQKPVLMGDLAVEAAVAACKHETVEKDQKIEPQLITQENKDDPKIRELLVPNVK